jgi:hypothetical protein
MGTKRQRFSLVPTSESTTESAVVRTGSSAPLDGDWLNSLVRQAATADTVSGKRNSKQTIRRRIVGKDTTKVTCQAAKKRIEEESLEFPNAFPSKTKRIERRALKKQRGNSERKHRSFGADPTDRRSAGIDEHHSKESNNSQSRKLTNQRMEHLSILLNTMIQPALESASEAGQETRKQPASWYSADKDDKKSVLSRERTSKSEGAAISRPRRSQWDSESIQPRKRDYGGMGLARTSLFLPFNDPSYIPKLTQEFEEHVPGFFGRQRTKAMKKQLNQNMLWKQVRSVAAAASSPLQQSDRKGVQKILPARVSGKKLADMTPDERVEAMIRAGLI